MSKANKIRREYNRTRRKWLIHPTQGRWKAMQAFKKAIAKQDLLETLRINPEARITFRDLMQMGLFP